MSVLLPKDKMWGVANWASRAFFRDLEPWLDQAPTIADEIRFCIQASLDTLDLREANAATLRELSRLIDHAITTNREKQGRDWEDPSFFPGYMQKLDELKATVQDAITETAVGGMSST